MTNLTDPLMLWLKAGLFIVIALLASALLIAQLPDKRYVVVFALAIWAFCRAYYFAFYVIEHYVDPKYHFAGLLHFARYALLGHAPDERDGD